MSDTAEAMNRMAAQINRISNQMGAEITAFRVLLQIAMVPAARASGDASGWIETARRAVHAAIGRAESAADASPEGKLSRQMSLSVADQFLDELRSGLGLPPRETSGRNQ